MRWTEEQIDYLQEKWGVISIPTIAKNLNRSINAVKLKANRIGLGMHLHSGEYITLHQFILALGRPFGGYTRDHWIKKGLPVKTKKSIKKAYQVIYIEEFWKWAEKNRMLVDFAKVEKNILGKEPEWVKNQREADIAASRYRGCRRWTEREDSLLKSMLKHYAYTYRDVSMRLKRTEGAIKRRIQDLGLLERPLPYYNHNSWTDAEVQILIDMYSKGYIAEVIAEKIPRSAMAIRGKLERMIYAGELKPRMECRKAI